MKGGGIYSNVNNGPENLLKTIDSLKQECIAKENEINSLNQKLYYNTLDFNTEITRLNSINEKAKLEITNLTADVKILVESLKKQCDEKDSAMQRLKQIQDDSEYKINMLNMELAQLKTKLEIPIEPPEKLTTDFQILIESLKKQSAEKDLTIQRLKQMKDDSDYDKNMLNMKLAQLKTREPLEPPKRLSTDSEDMEQLQKETVSANLRRAFYR